MAASAERSKVLIAGGGIAGLEAALALRALCGAKAELEMIAAAPSFWYRPLAVAEPFGLSEALEIDLRSFTRNLGAELRIEELERVDPAERLVRSSGRVAREYDFLIIATGAVREPSLEGAIAFVDEAGVERFKGLLGRVEGGEVKRLAFTAAADSGWLLPMYELALMTAEFATHRELALEIAVVTPESAPLEAFGPDGSAETARLLEEAGIEVTSDALATEVTDGELRVSGRDPIAADAVVAMPSLAGPAIAGLPATEGGFIPTDEHCRVAGHEREFATGDAADFPLKQGGIAAQMAGVAASAIAAELGALPEPRSFRPTLDGTLLGGREAHHLRRSLAAEAEHGSAGRAASWIPLWKVTAPHLTDYLGEHVSMRSASARVGGEEAQR